jgi:hypothetical protein
MTTYDESLDASVKAAQDAARASYANKPQIADLAAQAAASQAAAESASADASSAAGNAASSASSAAASAALVGAPAGSAIEANAGNAKIVYVSTTGNDSSSGKTWGAAKLTLAGAVSALGGTPGVIQLGPGTFTTSATHTLPSGTIIRGTGRNSGGSMLNYTGSGVLLQGTSGTRTYNQRVENVIFNGPGKASTAVAVDLVDVSQFTMIGCTLASFGTAIKHRSAVTGGAVYNTFFDNLVNSCTKGVEFTGTGSNGSRWYAVKFGANTTAVDILDSNQNNFHACQFEVNTTAIKLDATLAGLTDHNSFDHCRFEQNTTPWNIVSATVRDTEITWPAIFGTWTVPTDSGTRTKLLASYPSLPPPATQRSVLTRTGNYTLTDGEDILFMNAPSVTATLPSAVTAKSGRIYTIKNLNASALTVTATAGTIDGGTSVSLAQYVSARYVSDGANWFTV